MMIRFFLICLVLILAGPLSATDKAARFIITANGFTYGEMNIAMTVDQGEYSLLVDSQASGFFGLLTRAKYEGSAEGKILAATGLTPKNFTARSRRIFRDRVAKVSFLNGLPQTVSVVPQKDRTALSDPTSITQVGIDPLTYLAELVFFTGPDCPEPGNLYDGRRRTRISFEKPVQKQESRVCVGEYEIIEGPDHSLQPNRRKFHVRLSYRDSAATPSLQSAVFISGRNELEFVRR